MTATTTTSPLPYWNLVVYCLNVAVTFGIGVWRSPTNAELSEKYQTLVTPVGWAFAIWSLIFTMQAFWAAWPFCSSKKFSVIGYRYVWIVMAQAGWTLSFSHERIVASMLFMTALASFLWETVATLPPPATWKEYAVTHLPFTLHTGWITAATLVNANVVLVYLGVSAPSQYSAALLSLLLLFALAVSEVLRDHDWVIPATLAWAAYGIHRELSSPKLAIRVTFPEQQIVHLQQGAEWATMTIVALLVVRIGVRLTTRRQPLHQSNEATPLRE
jgi:hypothetical protein